MLNLVMLSASLAGAITMQVQNGRSWTNPGGETPFITCAYRGGEALASSSRAAGAIADRVVRICAPLLEQTLARQGSATPRQRAAVAALREDRLRTMRSLALRSVNRTRGII